MRPPLVLRGHVILLGVWLLAIVSGSLLSGYQPQAKAEASEQRTRNDVMIDVLGQSKTLLARYLWFKMDIFHEVLDEQGVKVEHQAQVLPLLRLVTLLDPSISDAYDIIAYDLVKGHGQVQQALDLLDEGLEHDPNNTLLLMRKALILIQEKRYAEAIGPAEKVTGLVSEEFDVLNANRLLYWSAKALKRQDLQAKALTVLMARRPDDSLWQREYAGFQAAKGTATP